MDYRNERLIIPYYFYLVPLLISTITLLLTYVYFDDIPSKIPTHTSITGEITYSSKTIGNIAILPIMQYFITFIMLGTNYVIQQAKQQLDANNYERSLLQNKRYRYIWSLFLYVTTILITFLFSFLQATLFFPTLIPYENIVVIVFIIILLFSSIALSVYTGQGGSKLKTKVDSPDDFTVDKDNDKYWKLGQFYVNKNDPSIFIEKRFGIGWTNNWAHPISWLLIVTILSVTIGIPAILFML